MMHRSTPILSDALGALIGFIADPRNDWRLLAEAGLELDPGLLPLLVALSGGPAGVVDLGEALGRDHSVVSRQLGRLQARGLVERAPSAADARVRTATLSAEGRAAVESLAGARSRLLDRALQDWPDWEREALAHLLARFVDAIGQVR